MRNIPEYVSGWFSPSRTVGKRTGLYPDRKRGPWTFLFRYLRLSFSRSLVLPLKKSTSSQFDLLSFSISSSLVSLAFFSLSLFLGKPSLWRGVPSFSFVRLIPRGSKRKQTVAIDGIRFPSFEENSRRKSRLKYLRRFLFHPFFFLLSNLLCHLNYNLHPRKIPRSISVMAESFRT